MTSPWVWLIAAAAAWTVFVIFVKVDRWLDDARDRRWADETRRYEQAQAALARQQASDRYHRRNRP